MGIEFKTKNAITNQYELWASKGLEVESLPADPYPIFNKLFPGFTPCPNWKGQARMRLIIFSELLRQFGIQKFYENNLNDRFSNSIKAEDIVKEKSGYDELRETNRSIENLIDYIESAVMVDLESEELQIKKRLDEWKKLKIEETLSDPAKISNFIQQTINDICQDKSERYDPNFAIPQKIKNNLIISEQKRNRISELKSKLKNIESELNEIYDDLTSDINEQ